MGALRKIRSTYLIVPLKDTLRHMVRSVTLPVFFLLVIGLINVYSATIVVDVNTVWYKSFFIKQILFVLLFSWMANWVYRRLNYRALKNWKTLMFFCGIMLLFFVLVKVAGITVNGAKRWISLGFLSFQPSELAKLVGVVWAAYWMGKSLEKQVFTWGNVVLAFLFPTLFAVFTMIQPDMGTAVLIMFFPFCLVCASGIRTWIVAVGLVIASVVGGYLVHSSPYRWERVLGLLDPEAHAQGLGYQSVQGMIAIGSSGFWGQGPAAGTSKYLYLPEAHTDFAFAVWAQEMGVLGTLTIVFLFIWFTWAGFSVAARTKDPFGSLLAYGLTLIISLQGLFNILMVSGWAPVTGVPLPFISYGGSSLMMNLIAIGMLANIAKCTNRDEQKELKERKSL